MTRTDVDRVGEILFTAFNAVAVRHGFAPRMQNAQECASWAWALLRHGPSEILIADVEGRAAGICCLNPRGDHGGVGPVAVDPAFQGRGIGRRLMNALVERAEGLQSVRLFQEAFNPASFSLYYSSGFTPVADLLDLTLEGGARKSMAPNGNITESTAGDVSAVHVYDIARSRLNRSADLAYYARWGKLFVYRQQSEISGYLACLPGSRSTQLGPLVAEGEEEAGCLFDHALGILGDRPCQTRVMSRDHALVDALMLRGFRLYCINILMVRGSWRPGRSIEAFGRFPEGI